MIKTCQVCKEEYTEEHIEHINKCSFYSSGQVYEPGFMRIDPKIEQQITEIHSMLKKLTGGV